MITDASIVIKSLDGLAARGKTSTGWFFGFKLHVVINHVGELLGAKPAPSQVDYRKPVPDVCASLFGKIYGDEGYLSNALGKQLRDTQGVDLITKVRKNMKLVNHHPFDQTTMR